MIQTEFTLATELARIAVDVHERRQYIDNPAQIERLLEGEFLRVLRPALTEVRDAA